MDFVRFPPALMQNASGQIQLLWLVLSSRQRGAGSAEKRGRVVRGLR